MQLHCGSWNIHGQGGMHPLPKFLDKEIKMMDIFVLTEFNRKNESAFNALKKLLSDYDLYCTKYIKGYNQVCICISKSLNYTLLDVKTINIEEETNPELLHVKIEVNNKTVNIIGVRIKTQAHKKPAQMENLRKILDEIPGEEEIICMGDLNMCLSDVKSKISNKSNDLLVIGPRTNNTNYFSHVLKTKDGELLFLGRDWIIARTSSDIFNPYDDSKASPWATYDWSFVSDDNGYKEKTRYGYLADTKLPDHAILKTAIII